MDSELEVIRQQMEGTRTSLAEKLDTLENEVLGTVHNATEAVAHTVEDVKSAFGSVTETIQETVESVKESFNLSEQVHRHPWGMLGSAAAAGFLGGWLLGPSREEPKPAASAPREPAPVPAKEKQTASSSSSGTSPLETLKGLAVGMLMGVVREMVTNALPEKLRADAGTMLDDFTAKLGGKTLHCAEEQERTEEQKAAEQKSQGNGKHSHGEAPMPAEASQSKEAQPAGQSGRKRGNSRF